jgi:hypothetical protein
MQTLDIFLWANEAMDWGVEVDGSRCEHLSPSAAHLLVRCALMFSETSQVACKDGVWSLRCFVSEMVAKRALSLGLGRITLRDHEAAS